MISAPIVITDKMVEDLCPVRPSSGHKGMFGRALYTVAAWALGRFRFFQPIFTDRAKIAGHIAAIAAMVLILLVPTAIDLINAALPNGLIPIS